MHLFEPASAHASTEPDGFCTAHPNRHHPDFDGLKTVASYKESRLWRVSGEEEVTVHFFKPNTNRVRRVVDLFKPNSNRVRRDVHLLTPGTLLRLDSISGQFYCDGLIHETTKRRFCVLEGALAGYCVKASDILWDDHESHTADSVEPLPAI